MALHSMMAQVVPQLYFNAVVFNLLLFFYNLLFLLLLLGTLTTGQATGISGQVQVGACPNPRGN